MEARNLQFWFPFEGNFSSAQFESGTKNGTKIKFPSAQCDVTCKYILGQRVMD